MRRNIFIGIGAFILAALALWFLFSSSEQPPLVGTSDNITGSPFGTPTDSEILATQPDFEGEVALLPDTQPTGGEGAKLFKLEASAVAGFVAITRGSGSTSSPQATFVRYAERGTGNIFEAKLPQVEKQRLTNETLPQIYEAYFREDGGAALFRTLDQNDVIKNMALTLTPPKATSSDAFYTPTMVLLRGEIDSISIGPGDVMTYVLKDADAIASSKFNGESAKTLWSGPFDSWRTGRLGKPSTSSGQATLLFTKPSFSLPGYAYRLVAGSLTKLLGPLNGLIVTTNPAGTHLIYSYSDGNTRLLAEELGKGAPVQFLPATLADKCVGSVQDKGVFYCGVPTGGLAGQQPDLWYQGKSHFSDDLWRFDVGTESAELVLEPEAIFGVSLDVSLPQISPDGKYLVFINKTDLSLWAAKIR